MISENTSFELQVNASLFLNSYITHTIKINTNEFISLWMRIKIKINKLCQIEKIIF